eukprot:CAMPEP_0181331108 /NCGR_PEP_ID=MMETSP1101-20121128/24304_1 /TAXON_ID=46948 /ORGANISM="Rhodomonas abbreviata, Strain Caron Lab Isolate" /LENGTH=67 /DNA_ID=CAMNT_0023440503 /DNA_START=32 /DNA_END=231 /DNA_ORIENTATION=-
MAGTQIQPPLDEGLPPPNPASGDLANRRSARCCSTQTERMTPYYERDCFYTERVTPYWSNRTHDTVL